MAEILAASVIVVKLTVSVPPVTVVVKVLSSAVFGGTWLRMSKLVSTGWPLMATLKTRWPGWVQ
jgi:hypothetical protein